MPVEIGRDISEFEVGMTRSWTRTFTVEDIQRFADITGDHNYFHVNEEAARHSVFGRLIAQGLLVSSMSTHMGGVVFPGPGFIAAGLNSRFLKPVYPGDTITCTIEITAVDPDRDWLELDARWVNQDGVLVADGSSSGRPSRVVYEPTGEGDIQTRPIVPEDRTWSAELLSARWGGPDLVSRGRVHDGRSIPGIVATMAGESVGLATYNIAAGECEIVTLDSLVEEKGIGTALIAAVKEIAESEGCGRLWLVTTNDNLPALGFYQRRGFELAAVHPRAVEEARKLKPAIPEIGLNDIPLRDEIELEFPLLPSAK